MSTTKKMVERDYIDAETGLRFVEDSRGNLHLVHTMGDMSMPAPVVNVETQSPITNNYNTTNNYYTVSPTVDYSTATKIVIQSRVQGLTWASDTNFNRINAGFGATGYMNYTVPFGKTYHFIGLIANQYIRGVGNSGISYIGIFRDGNLEMALPMLDKVRFKLDTATRFPPTSFVEFKFFPYDKKTDLGIVTLGYLL